MKTVGEALNIRQLAREKARARVELVRLYPCQDCGVPAGRECKPEYGCADESRCNPGGESKSAAGAAPLAPAAETDPLEPADVENLGRKSPSAGSSGAKGLTAQSPLEGTAPLTEPGAVIPLPAASDAGQVCPRCGQVVTWLDHLPPLRRGLPVRCYADTGLHSVHHRHHK